MGAPRHSPERRAEAMGALYASCDLVGDQLIPNVHAVAKRMGIDENALYRWWNNRDVSLDGKQREIAASRVALAAQKGADDWGNRITDALQKTFSRTEELLADDTRWKKAGVDEAARATRALTQTLREVASGLKDMAEMGKGNGISEAGLDGAVRNAIRRSRDNAGE